MQPQLEAPQMDAGSTRTSKSARRSEMARDRVGSERGRRTCSDQRDRIESVRASNPGEQVIARYIELHSNGRRLVGHCPFHNDPTPSFVVYISTQSWYCFGCGIGGDVFKFVELIEKIPFREALEQLAYGTFAARPMVHAPAVQLESTPSMELNHEHYALLTAAAEAYHAAIFTQGPALEYLAKRRIDLDVIRRHRIGYATGNDLGRYLRFRGWSHDLAEDDEQLSRTIATRRDRARDSEIAQDLGLVGARGEYFRQRIVIPELRNGKAIYLVGRATQDYQKAKYLGLPGVPKPLYGIESIRGAGDIFVVEGAIDWLTLIVWGYPTIAFLGSHLRSDLVNELRDSKRSLIVTYSDEPGRRGARRLAETFGKRARIVPPLPNAKDVNELATHFRGRERFAAFVQQAR